MANSAPRATLRLLTAADLPACLRLTALCGWNQTERDWRRFLALAPTGCLGVEVAGQLVGTTTVLTYGAELAWIGLVMVDPDYRGQGLARRLLTAALERAETCRAVGLDATPMGQPLYEKLGFVASETFDRMVAPALSSLAPGPAVKQLTEADLPVLTALDAAVTGASRPAVLAGLLEDAPELAWGLREAGKTVGFCLGRLGARSPYLGPVVAPHAEGALALLQAAAGGLAHPLALDAPRAQAAWQQQLAALGFVPERSLLRMYLRGIAPRRDPSRLFALAGGELG